MLDLSTGPWGSPAPKQLGAPTTKPQPQYTPDNPPMWMRPPIWQGGMHLRGKGKEGGSIVLLSHNINSINNVKLQQCIDMAVEQGAIACMVICLQETKLLQVKPP